MYELYGIYTASDIERQIESRGDVPELANLKEIEFFKVTVQNPLYKHSFTK